MFFSCNEFEDKDFKIIKRKEKMSAPSTSFCSQKHVPDGQTDCLSSPGTGVMLSMVHKVKRWLMVDSDGTEELHNKYRVTSKDREEKIRMFEKQLNIKIQHSPGRQRKSTLIDSHMSISLLFLSIMVLLLLNVFLIFKLTSRVEELENMLATVHNYVEKVTANVTTTPVVVERKNPGVIKGRRSKEKTKDRR